MALTKCFDLFVEDFRRGGIFLTIGHNLQQYFLTEDRITIYLGKYKIEEGKYFATFIVEFA